jgi:hypothetical protein
MRWIQYMKYENAIALKNICRNQNSSKNTVDQKERKTSSSVTENRNA